MYLNFHCHSVYSVQDALPEPIEIAEINKKMGNDAFCITDHGWLGSWIQAYMAAEKTGLQFIPGCEFYVIPEDEYWAYNTKNNENVETVDFACKYHHLLAIAKNQKGLQSLINIYNTNKEHYGKPCVTREAIFNNTEGVIISTACVVGEVIFYIKNDMVDKAREVLKLYKEKFGDDFYVELQFHHLTDVGGKREVDVYNTLVGLAKELNIEMLPTNDSHFLYKDDAINHNIYKALFTPGGKQKPYNYDSRSFDNIFDGDGYHVMTEEEIRDSISNITALTEEDIDHILDNTSVVRNKCENTSFPKAKPLEDKSKELRALVEAGFNKKRAGTDYEEESRERLEFELDTINNMGFSEYFINVYDILDTSRKLGILPGCARGCFLPGNQVTTKDGYKNIEEVSVGDFVLVKSGDYKEVKETYEYDADEECIELELSNGKTIRCTKDHKIFVGGEWIEAKDLKIGDELFNPNKASQKVFTFDNIDLFIENKNLKFRTAYGDECIYDPVTGLFSQDTVDEYNKIFIECFIEENEHILSDWLCNLEKGNLDFEDTK